jgi:hypothetical protein
VVVVDTSTNGTFVNGDRVQAERLLAAGDSIQIGDRAFLFDDGGSGGSPRYSIASGLPSTSDHPSRSPVALRSHRRLDVARTLARLAGRRSFKAKAAEWFRRYFAPELVGLGAAVAGSWLVYSAADSEVAAAFGGSIGESLGFYGTFIVREMVHDAYTAGARRAPYGLRQMAATWRGLLLEFGPAELVDSLLLRPFAMWLGQDFLGRPFGIVAGKFFADLAFYAPVIVTYELRTNRDHGAK